MNKLILSVILMTSLFCTQKRRDPDTSFTLEKVYRCFFNSSNSYLESENIKDENGRFLMIRTYGPPNSKSSILTTKFTYKDTLEFDKSINAILKTSYVSQNNIFVNKILYDSKNNIIKNIGKIGDITEYTRKYSKDSLIVEESEFIDGVKSYTHKFNYDNNSKIISKDWIYYECCSGKQPIFDREEYLYGENGKIIQKCKIMDNKIKRSYKGSFSKLSHSECISYKYNKDTLVEKIPFVNENTTYADIKTAEPTYYYKYIYERVFSY